MATKMCPNGVCKSLNTREDTMGFWICLNCGLVWKFVEKPTKEEEQRRKWILNREVTVVG